MYSKDIVRPNYLLYPLNRSIFIFCILLLTGATNLSTDVQLEFFQVESQAQEFVVTWKSAVEEDVLSYELTRRSAFSTNEQFVKIFSSEAHGTVKIYSFRDDQVYKNGTEKLDYQLQVVYTNGVREVVAFKSVNYTSTAVRRTWGSLKAMFQ